MILRPSARDVRSDCELRMPWLKGKFAKHPVIGEADAPCSTPVTPSARRRTLGEQVKKLHIDPVPSAFGVCRTIAGAKAISLGLAARRCATCQGTCCP